jgi:hypothetical protein
MTKIQEYRKEDKINYEKYLNYTILINEISSKCANDNQTNKQTYNKTYNDIYNISSNISDYEEIVFINKTESLLFCHNNSYFNFKVKIFEEFEPKYKSEFDLIISNLSNLIINRKIEESYLFNFLVKEISLEQYNFTLDDIITDFQDFQDLSFYINNMKNIEYRDELNSILILNYNISYNKFLNDYIIQEILSNIEILINEKILMQMNYIENRMVDNFKYYKLLLSETNLFGKTTKLAFLKLYDNMKLKINETINEQIENILFDLNIFCRSNIESFKNIYINEFIDDILKEIRFNQTLNNITYLIFDSIISKKINDSINNKLYHKIEELFINIDLM